MLVEAPDGTMVEWESPEWMSRSDYSPSIPDPLSVVVPYLNTTPQWLILGGLGDGDDLVPALCRWPSMKAIGIDPDPRAIKWQLEHGWPERFLLLGSALSDRIGSEKIFMDSLCCPSLHPRNLEKAPLDKVQSVLTVTLDSLDRDHGPFTDSILWLDLEGYDYKALLGASDLLTSGKVLIVGIEVSYALNDETNPLMFDLLSRAGYERVLVWFRQWWGHNEVWRRKK